MSSEMSRFRPLAQIGSYDKPVFGFVAKRFQRNLDYARWFTTLKLVVTGIVYESLVRGVSEVAP
jgi:hypothetical protein